MPNHRRKIKRDGQYAERRQANKFLGDSFGQGQQHIRLATMNGAERKCGTMSAMRRSSPFLQPFIYPSRCGFPCAISACASSEFRPALAIAPVSEMISSHRQPCDSSNASRHHIAGGFSIVSNPARHRDHYIQASSLEKEFRLF